MGFSSSDSEFYIRASLGGNFSCLSFPQQYARAKKNTIELFKPALGNKVHSVYQYLNERSFSICLENKQLILFKLHGNRSNVLHFEGGVLSSVFKSNLKKDYAIVPEKLNREITQSYENFRKEGCDIDKVFPTFGKEVKEYLKTLGFFEKDCDAKWQIIQETLQKLNSQKYYITSLHSEPIFSLLPFGKIIQPHSNPIDAINHFYQYYSGIYYLQKEKEEALKVLLKKEAQTKSYILKSSQKLNEIKSNSRHEEIANIIMANLHAIPQKAEEIELYDFYNNRPIKIKLKKDISPQRNAENLYRKAKNHRLEIKQLEENILSKKNLQDAIASQIKEVQETNDLKQLRRHVKNYNLVKESFKQEESLPYKEVYFEGYTILIGKSAKNNDLLIQQHAHKDDLWLHAKDVTGSHVIVKQKPGQNFPKNVIEKAAGIAAFHSKMKNDSVCPVIYTPRKFIRKVKGTAPGAVRVERESVILVPPSL